MSEIPEETKTAEVPPTTEETKTAEVLPETQILRKHKELTFDVKGCPTFFQSTESPLGGTTGKAKSAPVSVHLTTEIDGDLAEYARQKIQFAIQIEQAYLVVFIDSPGGEVYQANAIISMMETFRANGGIIITVGRGYVMSAAVDIFLAGTPGYRFVAPHTSFMVHDGSCVIGGTVSELKNETDHSLDLNERLFNRMNKACGHPPNFFQNLMKQLHKTNWYMFPDDVVVLGIADRVGTVTMRKETMIPEGVEKADVREKGITRSTLSFLTYSDFEFTPREGATSDYDGFLKTFAKRQKKIAKKRRREARERDTTTLDFGVLSHLGARARKGARKGGKRSRRVEAEVSSPSVSESDTSSESET